MSHLPTLSLKTRNFRRNASAAVAASLTAALVLAGCSADGDDENSESTGSSEAAEGEEVDAPEPRLLTTYDGGFHVLDANTLEVISDEKIDGFNRLNPVGDGRHALLSTNEGFQLIDAGVWTEDHGDHGHSYAGDPVFTDTVYEADTPGHVVDHDGNLVLFGDGDGTMQRFSTDDFLELSGDDPAPEPTVEETEPHHGVAVELADGTFVHTEGTEEYRDTVTAVDADSEEIDTSSDCPGVHGEATAADDVVAFGCENGILVFDDGEFTKVDAPDSYGRIGNQAGSDDSPVVLGDYKVEEDIDDDDDEIERPERVSLTNTDTGDLRLVDLGTSYSFQSLGRGPDGEALVLGTDGKLHVIDPESGKVTDSWEVIEPWEEPVDWQEPSPALFVQDDRAYVTEPETKEIHAVDLSNGKVVNSGELEETPNELTGVTG